MTKIYAGSQSYLSLLLASTKITLASSEMRQIKVRFSLTVQTWEC